MTKITRPIVAFFATLTMVLQMGCLGIFADPASLPITITPTAATLAPGQNQVFRVSVPLAHEQVGLDFTAGSILQCSPDSKPSETPPYTEDVTVTVPAGTPPGTHQFEVRLRGAGYPHATATINVVEDASERSFNLTSNYPTLRPGLHYFRLQVDSLGGFSGPVRLDWTPIEGVEFHSSVQFPRTVSVTPTVPGGEEFIMDLPLTEATELVVTATSGSITKELRIPINNYE